MFRYLILLALFTSMAVYSCQLSEIEAQQKIITTLVSKYKSDPKKPLSRIRKIDFLPGKRVRFLYLSNKISVENIIENVQLDEKCNISFKPLKF